MNCTFTTYLILYFLTLTFSGLVNINLCLYVNVKKLKKSLCTPEYVTGASEESTTQIKHEKTPKHHHLLLEYLFNLPCSQCAILYMNQNLPKHTGILGGIHTTVYTDQRQNCMRYTESSHVGYLKQQSTSSKSSLNNKMCTNQLSFSFPVLLSCVCSVLPSRSTVRRVAQVMNKVDRRKHDKFSNQFNYALN